MAAGLLVEEAAEIIRVHQVAVDGYAEAKRRINVEGLGLGTVRLRNVSMNAVELRFLGEVR